jgi:multiple sugar transport system substrate-binding protein
MDANVAIAEEAPTDILFIAKGSRNKDAAKRFLAFMSGASIQQELNSAVGMLPPNKMAAVSSDPLIQAGIQTLRAATGLSQFFDRDTPAGFSQPAMVILRKFLLDPREINARVAELESLRQENYR